MKKINRQVCARLVEAGFTPSQAVRLLEADRLQDNGGHPLVKVVASDVAAAALRRIDSSPPIATDSYKLAVAILYRAAGA